MDTLTSVISRRNINVHWNLQEPAKLSFATGLPLFSLNTWSCMFTFFSPWKWCKQLFFISSPEEWFQNSLCFSPKTSMFDCVNTCIQKLAEATAWLGWVQSILEFVSLAVLKKGVLHHLFLLFNEITSSNCFGEKKKQLSADRLTAPRKRFQ